MAAGKVALLTVMWAVLAAVAAADGAMWAPAPSPSGATGVIPSFQTVFVGFIVAAVSFSALKEFIWAFIYWLIKFKCTNVHVWKMPDFICLIISCILTFNKERIILEFRIVIYHVLMKDTFISCDTWLNIFNSFPTRSNFEVH